MHKKEEKREIVITIIISESSVSSVNLYYIILKINKLIPKCQ